MSGTGENGLGLRKILDMTRMSSITILLLHFYFYCYGFFEAWQLTTTITDRLLSNIACTSLFDEIYFQAFGTGGATYFFVLCKSWAEKLSFVFKSLIDCSAKVKRHLFKCPTFAKRCTLCAIGVRLIYLT
jgi:hypothetical protein